MPLNSITKSILQNIKLYIIIIGITIAQNKIVIKHMKFIKGYNLNILEL